VRFSTTTWGRTLAACALLAPAASAQAPVKIGIINIQGAILATKDGEKARESIRTRYESRAKGLEARTAEIGKLREQFSKGANTMSAEARERLSREIDDKQKRLQWDSEDLQSELQQEEQRLVNEIGQRMGQIIDEHAKGNAFTIVLDVSGQSSPVLWATNGIDLTSQVVELYDKKFGGGAAAPAAAPPAARPPAAAPPAAAPQRRLPGTLK
jgi:outer membrane protein